MTLDARVLRDMICQALGTRSKEIDCDQCFDKIDRFAELELMGRNAAEALPTVEDHLQHCECCREEYKALLAALRALG
jgi:predicted anti-sigma-YlaC factor YlaD